MNAYKPGDLAMATVRGEPDVLIVRRARGDWSHVHLLSVYDDDEVSDVRPMRAVPADAVVLDLTRLEWKVLRAALHEYDGPAARMVQAKIDSETRPPRPAEAVVEDADGRRWIRGWGQTGYYIWWSPDVERARFADLKVTRVLSEGWSE